MALLALDSLPASVRAWIQSHFDHPDTVQVEQLAGGANNLVFGCADAKQRVVAKVYPQASGPSQDRYRAEAEVLAFANQVAPGFVPKLISSDAATRLIVMEYLDGMRFQASSDITRAHVEHASAFIARLNADMAALAKKVSVSAADGFYTLSEHAENVASRIAELTDEHLPAQHKLEASSLISDVKHAWDDTQRALNAALGDGTIADELGVGQSCVSPSDFGFHNAILTPQGLKFFDFEFGGWDDPTKLYVDFFLQPRIRVPAAFMPIMESTVGAFMPLTILRTRAAALRPVLHLKWITIILAVLRPHRLEAMLCVAADPNPDTLITERLNRARGLLSQGIAHVLH